MPTIHKTTMNRNKRLTSPHLTACISTGCKMIMQHVIALL